MTYSVIRKETVQTQSIARPPGATYAISDTGPLISAFQSDSLALLARIFPMLHIPVACAEELENHGWSREVSDASDHLIIVKLTEDEEKYALSFAEQVARHPDTNDLVAENHLGEAQAIVLALRSEHKNDLLLIDELAARTVASQTKVRLSGFPGVLLLATRAGFISAENLKTRLEICREKGTHYGKNFIRQVFRMSKQRRRHQ